MLTPYERPFPSISASLSPVGCRSSRSPYDVGSRSCVASDGRVSLRAGFRGGAVAPLGVMISWRPPRRCTRISMRMLRALRSVMAIKTTIDRGLFLEKALFQLDVSSMESGKFAVQRNPVDSHALLQETRQLFEMQTRAGG